LSSVVDRYGINLSISKRIQRLEAGEQFVPSDTLYYATGDDSYFMNYILLANNTIIMEEDGRSNSQGDYYGLKLQKIKNSRAVNNAIEMADSTLFFNQNSNKYAAAVYYQGPSPLDARNIIDYNIYSLRSGINTDVDIDVYRYVNTDISGKIVDLGYREEYRSLNNWQNWMRTDMYSRVKSFMYGLEKSSELFPRYRIRRNPSPVNSPLDRNGTYLAEALTDIDGKDRNYADQRLDIGAELVRGEKFASDVEVLNIYSPATYKANRGPFKDAEYFMVPDTSIKVTALLRNNGNSPVSNKRVTLRVFEESQLINNSVANSHNVNFNTIYYNNERAHLRDLTNFAEINIDITPPPVPFFTETKYVTIAPGEGYFVDFNFSRRLNTYFNLQSSGYLVPKQFSTMLSNVTPRYLFVVSVDSTNDQDPNNNLYKKYSRFFVKKSTKDILISASNTFNDIYTLSGGYSVPNTSVTNPDMVAGKLNLDSLKAGFYRLKLVQYETNEQGVFDYDVLDRSSWDYRNVDYTLYRTLYISDELEINEAR